MENIGNMGNIGNIGNKGNMGNTGNVGNMGNIRHLGHISKDFLFFKVPLVGVLRPQVFFSENLFLIFQSPSCPSATPAEAFSP